MPMSVLAASSPRILVADHDQNLQDLLNHLLEEEGYQPVLVSSLEAALEEIDQQAFHFILTDLFVETLHLPFQSVSRLRQRSYPTPIGVMTGWNVRSADARQSGFAFLLTKPFDLDEMLTKLAAALHQPFSPEQQRQAQLVKQYFQAMKQRDWAALGALVTDHVALYPAGRVLPPFIRKVSGRGAFLAYAVEAHQRYRELDVGEVVVYPLPKGLAVRYQAYWFAADGARKQIVGRLILRFQGDQIHQVGVRSNRARLQAIEG